MGGGATPFAGTGAGRAGRAEPRPPAGCALAVPRRCGQRGRGRWRHGALTEQGGRRCGRGRVGQRRRRGEIVGMRAVGDQALGDRLQRLRSGAAGFGRHGGQVGIRRRSHRAAAAAAVAIAPPCMLCHQLTGLIAAGTEEQPAAAVRSQRPAPQLAQSPEHPSVPRRPLSGIRRRLNPGASVSRLRALSANQPYVGPALRCRRFSSRWRCRRKGCSMAETRTTGSQVRRQGADNGEDAALQAARPRRGRPLHGRHRRALAAHRQRMAEAPGRRRSRPSIR